MYVYEICSPVLKKKKELIWEGTWADSVKLEEKGRVINTGKKACRSTLAYYSNLISFIA